MQGERIALVFEPHAAMGLYQAIDGFAQGSRDGHAIKTLWGAIGAAANFRAMQSRGRQLQWFEQPVQIVDQPSADQRQGAIKR